MIEILEATFRKGVSEASIVATALVYDILTIPPGKSEKMDAIKIELEHREGYSVSVFQPYKLKNSELIFEPIFASKTERRIFNL